MAVFENESNASQDASYREHLDRNWLNGNTAFDQINQNIADWQNLISSLSSRVSTLESENDKRIQENISLRNELTNYQLKTDQRLQRLEAAIFDYGAYEVNYETPHHDSSVTEINVDSNPLLKGE